MNKRISIGQITIWTIENKSQERILTQNYAQISVSYYRFLMFGNDDDVCSHRIDLSLSPFQKITQPLVAGMSLIVVFQSL